MKRPSGFGTHGDLPKKERGPYTTCIHYSRPFRKNNCKSDEFVRKGISESQYKNEKSSDVLKDCKNRNL